MFHASRISDSSRIEYPLQIPTSKGVESPNVRMMIPSFEFVMLVLKGLL